MTRSSSCEIYSTTLTEVTLLKGLIEKGQYKTYFRNMNNIAFLLLPMHFKFRRNTQGVLLRTSVLSGYTLLPIVLVCVLSGYTLLPIVLVCVLSGMLCCQLFLSVFSQVCFVADCSCLCSLRYALLPIVLVCVLSGMLCCQLFLSVFSQVCFSCLCSLRYAFQPHSKLCVYNLTLFDRILCSLRVSVR